MNWATFILLLGPILLGIGISNIEDQRRLQARGIVVLGKVVNKQRQIRASRKRITTSYLYTVEFRTLAGELRQWETIKQGHDLFVLREKVPIVYEPDGVDRPVFLRELNPFSRSLSFARGGAMLVGIGSSLLMHPSASPFFLAEVVLWSAGVVAAVHGFIIALSQWHLLQSGIEVMSVAYRTGGREGSQGTSDVVLQFVMQSGVTSYHCPAGVSINYTPAHKIPLLYDPRVPLRAMRKSKVMPLTRLLIHGGNSALLCFTAVLLMFFRTSQTNSPLPFLGAMLCLIGLWGFYHIGIITLIKTWRSVATDLPSLSLLDALLGYGDTDLSKDTTAIPRTTHQNRSTDATGAQKRSGWLRDAAIYNPVTIAHSFRPALLKTWRLLLVTGAIGACFFIAGTLIGKGSLTI